MCTLLFCLQQLIVYQYYFRYIVGTEVASLAWVTDLESKTVSHAEHVLLHFDFLEYFQQAHLEGLAFELGLCSPEQNVQ